MERLMVFENQPYEYGEKERHEIGYRLVNYLPVEWTSIPSGMQEHGVHIRFEPSPELENCSPEEIVSYTINKLFDKGPDGKLYLKGKGKMRNAREIAFERLLCDFLTLCNQNNHFYTEQNFVHVMEINGFHIPTFFYRAFDLLKKEEVSTCCFMPSNLYNVKDTLEDIKNNPITFAREYRCNTEIDYYCAVALEIIRQKKHIKQCEHCKQWFVTSKKSDEKYCKRMSPHQPGKTCCEVMRQLKNAQRIQNSPLKQAKERARNRAYQKETLHPGSVNAYKTQIAEWDCLYKSGQLCEEEYIRKLNRFLKKEQS